MFSSATSILATFMVIYVTLAGAQEYTIEGAVFNASKLKHFIHVDILSAFPINTTTIDSSATQVPNMGGIYPYSFPLYQESLKFMDYAGNVTGAIEGSLIPVGASYETLAPGRADRSFYGNRFTINTTTTAVVMEVRAVMQYANNALHGFGSATFTTDGTEANKYAYTNYGSFVVEVDADFKAGRSGFDVFELETGGRIDGEPIKALLPPGEA